MDAERQWARQEQRGSLAETYWHLAGARPGWRVADVGCGPGYFAMRFASMTGPTGLVHAVDTDPAALAYLRQRLDPVHHAHVTTEVLDVSRAPLPDLRFHALFCAAMLHHVEDLAAVLSNLRRSGAPTLFAEFDPTGPGEIGPPLDRRLGTERLTRALRDDQWRIELVVRLPFEQYAILARPI